MNRVAFFSLLIATIVLCVCGRKDRNVPHGHFGILKAHAPGSFEVELQASDEQVLSAGKSVMKQVMPKPGETDSAGGVFCVQDIEAPKEAVWNQILGMDEYEKKVAKVLECKNYEVRRNENGSITIKTRQKLGVLPGYSYENYYDHTYEPEKDSLTWRLDYEKKSDFDDVAGHWHVEDHPTKPGCTRVFYACDIKLSSPVPGPVLNFISKSALKQATAWVKKESELDPTATIPSQYAASDAVASTLEPQPAGRFGGFANRLNKRR